MGRGCDYSFARPNMVALRNAGMTFACRYLSYNPAKNLTRGEAGALLAHGIAPVSNWEATATGPLGGHAAGVNHARTAAIQHTDAGGPPDRPIYFSVDFDVQGGDLHQIAAYFDGINAVIGVNRTGIYGGIYVCSAMFSTNRAPWIWQTSAWSRGQLHARARIYQYAYKKIVGGGEVDFDTSYGTDYGQWHAPAGGGSGEKPVTPGTWDLAVAFNGATNGLAGPSNQIDALAGRINSLIR